MKQDGVSGFICVLHQARSLFLAHCQKDLLRVHAPSSRVKTEIHLHYRNYFLAISLKNITGSSLSIFINSFVHMIRNRSFKSLSIRICACIIAKKLRISRPISMIFNTFLENSYSVSGPSKPAEPVKMAILMGPLSLI